MKPTNILVATFALILVAGLSSCEKRKSYTSEDGTVEVDRNSGEVTFRGKDGEGGTISVTGTYGAKLPKDFPSDIPLYPGAKIVTAMSIGDAGHNVSLESSDGPDKIVGVYSKTLEGAGWEKTGEMNLTQMRNLNFAKESRSVTVSVISNPKKSATAITLAIANATR